MFALLRLQSTVGADYLRGRLAMSVERLLRWLTLITSREMENT